MQTPLSKLIGQFLSSDRATLTRFLLDHDCVQRFPQRTQPINQWNEKIEELYQIFETLHEDQQSDFIEKLAIYVEEVFSPSQMVKIEAVTKLIASRPPLPVPQALALAAYKLHLETGQSTFSASEISSVFSILREDAASVSSNLGQLAKAKTKEPVLTKADYSKSDDDQMRYEITASGQRLINDLLMN